MDDKKPSATGTKFMTIVAQNWNEGIAYFRDTYGLHYGRTLANHRAALRGEHSDLFFEHNPEAYFREFRKGTINKIAHHDST